MRCVPASGFTHPAFMHMQAALILQRAHASPASRQCQPAVSSSSIQYAGHILCVRHAVHSADHRCQLSAANSASSPSSPSIHPSTHFGDRHQMETPGNSSRRQVVATTDSRMPCPLVLQAHRQPRTPSLLRSSNLVISVHVNPSTDST